VLCTPAFAILAIALFLVLSSCRMGAEAPARQLPLLVEPRVMSTAAGDADPLPATIEAMVPAITHLHAEARRDSLFIRGELRPRDRSYAPFYDPSRVGGWSLQVFIDNDHRNVGYWRGYEYVVRGVEWTPEANSFVTRLITLDPDTPGGWGPEVGRTTFTQKQRSFEIAIPLESIGGIESSVDYCVETYATLACPICEGGLTQEWSDDYFATLGDTRSHDFASVSAPGSAGLAATSVLVRGHGADAAAHLARGAGGER